MTTIASAPLKELQDMKAFLTTQKEILELKTEIAALSKAVETPVTPAAETPAEPAGDSDKNSGNEEGGSEESTTDTAGYMAEITAYEVLKATAIKIGEKITTTKGDRVLVVGDQCLAERCLPLSDLALHQTKAQIDFTRQQVDNQIAVIEGILPPSPKITEEWAISAEEEREDDVVKDLFTVATTWLTGWGGAVDAAVTLIDKIGTFLGQFSTTFTVQARDVTLPVEALIAATVGAIPDSRAHLLALSRIQIQPASVIDKLTGLIQAVQKLDEIRIRLVALVVTPLTAETIKLTNSIARHETTKATLATTIATAKNRIGELNVEKKKATDPAKKAHIQDKIDLETKVLKNLKQKLVKVTNLIAVDQERLTAINVVLFRANAEADVAANLAKGFTTFFQSITAAPDKATLPTLAKAVLREHILTFSHLLRLSIHSGGGEMVARKFAWWNLKPAIVGGCAVSYTLVTTKDGKTVQSGLEVAAGQRKFSYNKPTETTLEIIPIG